MKSQGDAGVAHGLHSVLVVGGVTVSVASGVADTVVAGCEIPVGVRVAVNITHIVPDSVGVRAGPGILVLLSVVGWEGRVGAELHRPAASVGHGSEDLAVGVAILERGFTNSSTLRRLVQEVDILIAVVDDLCGSAVALAFSVGDGRLGNGGGRKGDESSYAGLHRD